MIGKQEALERIYEIIEKNGGIAKKEMISAAGVDYRRVLEFVESGQVIRLKNGYYTDRLDRFSEIQLVSKLFPDGVLCMDSALYYYGYQENQPECWHMAVDKNTSKSRFLMESPKVLPYYTEADALAIGCQEIEIEGSPFFIYEKERLAADCIRYEKKMGVRKFQSVIRAFFADPEIQLDKLEEYARARRVSTRVTQLLETMSLLDLTPARPGTMSQPDNLLSQVDSGKEEIPKPDNLAGEIPNWVPDQGDFVAGAQGKGESEVTQPVSTPSQKSEPISAPVYVPEARPYKKVSIPDLLQKGISAVVFELLCGETLPENLALYAYINEALKRQTYSSRTLLEELGGYFRERNISPAMDQLDRIGQARDHAYLPNRWQQYVSGSAMQQVSWEDVMNRLETFCQPLWKALCDNEIFLEDWMPELGRYMN